MVSTEFRDRSVEYYVSVMCTTRGISAGTSRVNGFTTQSGRITDRRNTHSSQE